MSIAEWLLALIWWLAALIPGEAYEEPVPPTATATAVATATPEPASLQAIICAPQYAWDCETALAIVECESGGDPSATGKLGEAGWWQIHPVHGLGEAGYDPVASTTYAHQLWLDAGFTPWSCYAGSY